MRNKYTITPKTIGHKILLLVFPLLFFANYAFGQVSCPIVIKEPSTAAFTSSPQTICIGNSTNLVIHLNRDSQGPATTSWVLKYSDGASTTTINTSAPPSGVVVTSGANSVDLTIPVTPTTTTTYSIVDLSDSWFGTASNCNYTSPYTNSVTITVTPDATIALSSAAATTNQTPCINTAITDITYAIGNATGATVTGLPAGVTGTYASGVFTISGTPTASGTFNYTVSTTGSCVTPSLSGTITITPDATIALSSAAATTNQTPCINTAITDITYAIGNATGATVTGLPAGVTGTYASGVFTISGTPTASGTFNYTVSTTGSCVTPSLSGTITITPDATIALSSAAATTNQTPCINTAITDITYAIGNATGATVTGLPAGVTGTYASGVFTISGTPTASGTFNYTVSTTGSCVTPSLSGTITITPDATIALSSAAATTNQTPCINTAITDITYAIGNATGATVTGLPAGVTGTYASGVFTISGTPTASGTFNYTVSTTGSCVTPSLSGTITINAPITFTSTYTNVACANAPSTAAITVTLNGGSGSYKLILQLNGVNYKTDTVTGTTYSFTGLPKGSYTIIVEDANVNGCAGTCNGATLTP